MRKKEDLLGGVYNVYAVYDKISKRYKKLYYATTDEDMIRLNLPTIVLETPLRELNIFRIGKFNDVTGEFKQTIKKRIDTDCYLFPHSKLSPQGENLSHEEVEEAVNKTKNEILASVEEENKKED